MCLYSMTCDTQRISLHACRWQMCRFIANIGFRMKNYSHTPFLRDPMLSLLRGIKTCRKRYSQLNIISIDLQDNSTVYTQWTGIVRIASVQILTSEGGFVCAYPPSPLMELSQR